MSTTDSTTDTTGAGPVLDAETAELHGPGITAAASALSAARVVVGFTTFLLAFHFKELESVEPWDSRVGLVACVVTAQVGFLLGSAVAPHARRYLGEEQMIVAALGVLAAVGVLTSLMGELAGAVLLAFTVALASNTAKQAFDAVVQRDAPDANRGRAFARFETERGTASARQELAWLDAKLSLYEAAPLEAGLDLGLGAHLLQAEGQLEPPLRSRSDGVWGLLGSLGAHARLDLTAATALGLSVRALGVLPRQGIALSSDRVELSQPLLSASAGVIVGL